MELTCLDFRLSCSRWNGLPLKRLALVSLLFLTFFTWIGNKKKYKLIAREINDRLIDWLTDSVGWSSIKIWELCIKRRSLYWPFHSQGLFSYSPFCLQTILTMSVPRFGIGSTNKPPTDIFLYYHDLSARYCTDIVRRNSVTITHGRYRVKLLTFRLLANPKPRRERKWHVLKRTLTVLNTTVTL